MYKKLPYVNEEILGKKGKEKTTKEKCVLGNLRKKEMMRKTPKCNMFKTLHKSAVYLVVEMFINIVVS